MTRCITMFYHYAECHYSECHVLFILVPNVIMLSVIILSVVMLNIVKMSAIMLSAIMLSAIMLIVIMLSVVVPWPNHQQLSDLQTVPVPLPTASCTYISLDFEIIVRKDLLPVSAARWQHESQIYIFRIIKKNVNKLTTASFYRRQVLPSSIMFSDDKYSFNEGLECNLRQR